VPGRTEFQRAILSRGDDGGASVRVTGDQGSGILSSMSRANCFVVLGAEVGNLDSDSEVDVQLLDGLL
ncbi:MAG: molybdopterin molybdenumtransferase MoeA, partial [Casimicrobiaceae bacterium]